MEKKYHVNTATGDIGPCRATKGKCPFGDENHYSSLVAAAQACEASMEIEETKRGLVHWNPRTNSPAACYTGGCAVGASKSEHYSSYGEAARAQEHRWFPLLDAGKLRGKELTAVAKYSDNRQLLEHALRRGTVQQWSYALNRYGNAIRRSEEEGKKLPPNEAMRAYEISIGLKRHETHPEEFSASLPYFSGAKNMKFLAEHGWLSEEEVELLVARAPYRFSFGNSAKENGELVEILERKVDSKELTSEDYTAMANSVRHVSQGDFAPGRFGDPKGVYYESIRLLEEKLRTLLGQ